MKAFDKFLDELESYERLKDDIKNKNTPILATGVIDVQNMQLASALSSQLMRPALIIAENELMAKKMYEDYRFFDKNVCLFPSRDIIFFSADVHSRETDIKRFKIINSLLKGERKSIIISAETIFDRFVKKEIFEKSIITLSEGDIVNTDELIKKLVMLGYERTEQIEGTGQFSVRGGIIDIFSPVEDNAVRIELWDDEIDTIRIMDVYTQRSTERTEKTEIFPVCEVVYDDKTLQNALIKMEKDYKEEKNSLFAKGFEEAAQRLADHAGEDIDRLKTENRISACGRYINYFYDDTVNILDYMSEDTMVFFCEEASIRKKCETAFSEFSESVKSRMEKGYILKKEAELLFDYEEAVKKAEKFDRIYFSMLMQSVEEVKLKSTVSFTAKSTASFNKRIDMFADELKSLKKEGGRIVILTSGQNKAERLIGELLEQGVEAAYVQDAENAVFAKGTVTITRGSLSRGFEYPQINFSLFSDHEIFDEKGKKKKKPKKKNSSAIESFTDLKVGDYVVHSGHGIGIFKGLEKISVDGINKDYIKIAYADGGSLFVPVNQMDSIQKYIGGEKVKLNKLGGQEWNKAKNKVRAAVEILAEDLVALYAKRQAAKGFVYSEDNLWQREFEEAFPYDETDDQLNAINDVKHDMETGRVMDRLVCGDVGYGKTEVAIRAAFKAVQDGKQVAYLVPTTILAQQHYNTFAQRMKDYPVHIGLLSRFRSAKQQKETLKDLESGMCDIIIGTHRILSKDVKFKDLGLVIVDEEQRFGVAHKEKLKSMKENLDVLTLTATPIPRTLHMSLSGIRDMSILEEPPEERRPVQTYVMENDTEFIKEAINRELARDGQVYYLYNRVESISQEAAKVQRLVPDANVAFAHGQMSERELEGIMKDFIEGEIDVLVCTTIIETGLDIGNVNTMIIQDADKMGLSQLYQLRGRVGRTNKTAFAYLMYNPNRVLNEVSQKRLQTIKEFTEFGSGFKIAMRDLEIRGAGNLLGAQQHGHMDAVGYEMYCHLLDEAVKKLRGEEVEEDFETMVDLNINAYIPPFYIQNEEQKLEAYKKISHVTNTDEYFDVQEELEDRYGTMPKSVNMLLKIVVLKARAHAQQIVSIVEKQGNIVVSFKGDAKLDPKKITGAIVKRPKRYLFTSATNPYVTIKTNERDKLDQITYVKEFLDDIEG